MVDPPPPPPGPIPVSGSVAAVSEGSAATSSPVAGNLPRICPSCQHRYPADFRICPRDGTPLEDVLDPEADPLIGITLGDTFQIIRQVGEGGMACVYEARHVRLPGKKFAVKVLHPALREPHVVARFQREAEAASGIDHPNVVDVFDVHRMPDGTPYLVSEFLHGTDFSVLLEERGKIEVPLAIHVIRQVVRALAAAHARGVVHRDVKPENVFLVGDAVWPVAKVLDFGISKVDEGPGGSSLTRTGMVMGTPGYIAPEQARGSRVDHRADIYGVGATLYHALTGQLPFDSEDSAEALARVLTEEPPRPRSINPEIPVALEIVIERAMAKDPQDRYATMLELDAELEPFAIEGRSVSLLPAAPVTPAVPVRGPSSKSASTVVSNRGAATARARAAREAQYARPLLVGLSLAAYAWTIACLTDAAASTLSLVSGTEPPAPPPMSTTLIILVVVIAVSTTPVVFWVRHLSRRVWANTSRAVEMAAVLQQTVVAALIAYAVAALALRTIGAFAPTVALSSYAGAVLQSLLSVAAGGIPGLRAVILRAQEKRTPVPGRPGSPK